MGGNIFVCQEPFNWKKETSCLHKMKKHHGKKNKNPPNHIDQSMIEDKTYRQNLYLPVNEIF